MKVNRTLKFWWQRHTRGWDDSETWDLDVSLAKLILPRLRRFKELSNGTPISYFKFEGGRQVTPDDVAARAWHDDLNIMIAGFEWFAGGNWETEIPTEMQVGLDLFAKHFRELGW